MRQLVPAIMVLATLSCKTSGSQVRASPLTRKDLSGDRVGLNDATMLFPLLLEGAPKYLPKASDVGQKGVMIPADYLEQMKVFARFDPKNSDSQIFRDNTKLYPAAMRLDPCFPAFDPDDSKCMRQMRLVWQAYEVNGTQGPLVADEGIHTHYQLTNTEFSSLVKAIVALKRAAGASADYDKLPLDIQPLIVRQGWQGDFAQGMFALIKQYGGQDNLVKVAFLSVVAPELLWFFGPTDVDREHGKLVQERVPTMLEDGVEEASITNFSINSVPPFQADDSLKVINNGSYGSYQTEALEQPVYDAFLRIENPKKVTVLSTDCTSCHLAAQLRKGAEITSDPKAIDPKKKNDNRYTSHWNLTNAHQQVLTTLNVHNISYDGNVLSVNQRVINETAEVADWINVHLFGDPDHVGSATNHFETQ